jgi:RNA polymerase sigma-70 factor (ECF subfamily)
LCSEEQLDLHTAIQQLRLEYREAICLYYLEGLSVKDISVILGRNENTVKTHLVRGREHLKKFLEG